MTWILVKAKLWNFHGDCQENDGISRANLVSFSTKRHETIRVTFFTGVLIKNDIKSSLVYTENILIVLSADYVRGWGRHCRKNICPAQHTAME